MPPAICLAVVNYNSGYRLQQCIEAIAQHPPSADYEVVVVDNASSDGSADFLKAKPHPHVKLIANPVNILTIPACNQALEASTAEIFMIYNPDMVATPGAFDNILRHLSEDATIGAVGGYTLNPRGEYERYVRRFPSPVQVVLGNYTSSRPFLRRRLRSLDYGLDDLDFTKPQVVDISVGGCLAFRRSILAGVPLSEDFGIFYGDTDLCMRIAKAGYKTMVFPDAPFHHDHKERKMGDARSMELVLDYLVGCEAYFRKWRGPWGGFQVKVLFGTTTAISLLGKHLPLALVRKESWTEWNARRRVLVDFLRGRNALLIAAKERAASLRAPAGAAA